MALTTSTVVVPTPVDVVWGLLARFGEISRWGPGVDQSSLMTRQDQGIGVARRVQVGRNALRETITVWEPPYVLGYRIEGLPRAVLSASNRWTLADEAGGTRITLTGAIQTRGGALPSRVAARLLGRVGARLVLGLAGYLARVAR